MPVLGLGLGAAYVFERGTSWTLKQTLASHKPGDNFGYTVAISPNGERVVVGAQGDDVLPGNDNYGAAYFFERDGLPWNPIPQKLEASDRERGDRMGISVAASDAWVAVGAHREGTGGLNAGATYLFQDALDNVRFLIAALIDEVVQLGLGQGLENALVNKLEDARDRFETCRSATAIHRMTAFRNQVDGLRNAGKLTPMEAADLLAHAQAIIDAIISNL